MVLFVDLDEENEPPQTHGYHHSYHHGYTGYLGHPALEGAQAQQQPPTASSSDTRPGVVPNGNGSPALGADTSHQPQTARENPNQNAMTEALGCYPIVMAIASSLDLNSLDNLSRTCHQIRRGLLQYHDALITHTLHCENEDVPVDPEDTFRYRARAGNWFYMEDGRGDYTGKSGSCARDMVAECRRCSRVVCRNCAIKPPAPVVLRDRHRRLCIPCGKAPLATIARPSLRLDTPLDAPEMRRAICTCDSEGVWLCQPCGRSIRGADHEYQSIWKWRSQYGDVIGGVGTGIGEGDRGVICGRGEVCCAARERQQETDCDAEDAREVDMLLHGSSTGSPTPPPSRIYSVSAGSSSSGNLSLTLSHSPGSRSHTPEVPANSTNHHGGGGSGIGGTGTSNNNNPHPWLPPLSSSPDLLHSHLRRTPTPTRSSPHPHSHPQPQRPGYARQEIEGIGGVVKTKLVRIVRVGACVPEDEERRGSGRRVLAPEIEGRARSWCGWCWRVIPGELDRAGAGAGEGKGKGKGGPEEEGEGEVRRRKRSSAVAFGEAEAGAGELAAGKQGESPKTMDLPMR